MMTGIQSTCPLDGAPLKGIHRATGKPTVYEHQDGRKHADVLPAFTSTAEPFTSPRHPVWAAVGDGPATLHAVVDATRAADPVYAVTRLIDASVRAALVAVGYLTEKARVFEIGDAEPDDVTEVRDVAWRAWVRNETDRLWYRPGVIGPALPWAELLDRTGELVEVVR